MYEVIIKTRFAAAHYLRNYKGACEALHGHNWKVDMVVEAAKIDHVGLAIDFGTLREKADKIISRLDHTCLNELDIFKEANPSSENIAKQIFNELKKEIGKAIKLKKVTVWETDDAAASYYE